jgi:DNA-binding NtrC family response regulator
VVVVTILVADDYEPVRTSLRAILESQAHDIVEAEDGAEALAIIRDGEVEVLLLDLYMPNCDGIEVLRQLDAPPPKVIVVSAFEYISTAEMLEEFGDKVFRFLSKSVRPDELLKAVADALVAARSVRSPSSTPARTAPGLDALAAGGSAR